MVALVDFLQCLGVPADEACNVSSAVARNKPLFPHLRTQLEEQQRLVAAISEAQPTFMELYGRGKLLDASQGCSRNLNLRGLGALDLRTCKSDGFHWDINLASGRQEAIELIRTQRPTWVIGSPPCTAFSRLNINLNFPRMSPEVVQQRVQKGIRHLHFMCAIYKMQMKAGRFFHEHPEGATSWSDPWMQRLLSQPSVRSVVADQCMYGLITWTDGGSWLPAMKPTRFATNSPQMALRLQTRCDRSHAHQPLWGGGAELLKQLSIRSLLSRKF